MIRNNKHYDPESDYRRFKRHAVSVQVSWNTLNTIKEMTHTLGFPRDRLFDNMVASYNGYRSVVVSVFCKISRKFYIDIVSQERMYSEDFERHLFQRCDTGLHSDYLEYGIGEFIIYRHGLFASQKEAMDYRDFLINRFLDSGFVYYGFDVVNGIVPRFLTIKMKLEIVEELFEYCRVKKMTVNRVVGHYLKKLLRP